MSDATDIKPTIPCPPGTCRAQRHMTPSEFVTYNTMMGFAKAGQNVREDKGDPRGDLIFWGNRCTLANANNRSDDVESKNVEVLVAAGWLIPTTADQPRWRGDFSTYKFKVLEHDEWAASHADSCPAWRYVPDKDWAKKLGLKPGDRLGEKEARDTTGLETRAAVKRIARAAKGVPGFDYALTEAEQAEWQARWPGLTEEERKELLATRPSLPRKLGEK